MERVAYGDKPSTGVAPQLWRRPSCTSTGPPLIAVFTFCSGGEVSVEIFSTAPAWISAKLFRKAGPIDKTMILEPNEVFATVLTSRTRAVQVVPTARGSHGPLPSGSRTSSLPLVVRVEAPSAGV